MSRANAQYVQINLDGLDLIERGVSLEKGSIYPVSELLRIDEVTLKNRLQKRWLLPRTEQQYKHWKNTGKLIITPPKLTGRAKKRAEKAAAEAAQQPPPPPPPAEKPETPTEEPDLPEAEESKEAERGTLVNPLRDDMDMEEYYDEYKLPPKPGKKASRRAVCPHCKQTWTSAPKIWACCSHKGVYTPEEARPPPAIEAVE